MPVPTKYSEKDINFRGVKDYGITGKSMAEQHYANHPLARITETMWKENMHGYFSMKGGDEMWERWCKIAGSPYMRVIVCDDTTEEPLFWVPALKYTYSTQSGDNIMVLVDQIGQYSRVQPGKSERIKRSVTDVIVGNKPSSLDVAQITWIAKRYGLGGVDKDPMSNLEGQSLSVAKASSDDIAGEDEEW